MLKKPKHFLSITDLSINEIWKILTLAKKVTSRMANIIMARVFEHSTIEELAANSSVPVINGLSNLEHPCQILADLMTIWEVKKKLEGLKIAYVGDCENNVTHSFALASKVVGFEFAAAGPRGHWLK